MTNWLDDRTALAEQYADAENLQDRQALHAEYSTADIPLRDWQFDQFELGTTADVLTIGCGPGDLWPEVEDRIPDDWSLTLTDFSEGMVQTARDEVGHGSSYAVADATALPFTDASFDAVTANHMLYHVPERNRVFADCSRVLRPGGRFYATTNGETSMTTIYDVLEEVLGHRPARGSEFTLENGGEQLAPHFETVECRRFDDALVVDEVEPLVRYVLSRDDVPASEAPALHRAFAERFQDGQLRIEKDLGMFVARKSP